jgi:hypothetical protein
MCILMLRSFLSRFVYSILVAIWVNVDMDPIRLCDVDKYNAGWHGRSIISPPRKKMYKSSENRIYQNKVKYKIQN